MLDPELSDETTDARVESLSTASEEDWLNVGDATSQPDAACETLMPGSDSSNGAGVVTKPSTALDVPGLLAATNMLDFPLARAWMCEQLRASGTSERVLNAMSAIPRHAFAPLDRWRIAYTDLDLWTGWTWMTAPGTIARVLDSLPRRRPIRVLEIGTGTGYQSALLAAMNVEIVSVDVSWICVAHARARLHALGAGASVQCGNGLTRRAFDAKFDAVVVNAAISFSPAEFFELLPEDDGTVVVPTMVSDGSQHLLKYENTRNGIEFTDFGACRFQPIIR